MLQFKNYTEWDDIDGDNVEIAFFTSLSFGMEHQCLKEEAYEKLIDIAGSKHSKLTTESCRARRKY